MSEPYRMIVERLLTYIEARERLARERSKVEMTPDQVAVAEVLQQILEYARDEAQRMTNQQSDRDS